MKFAEILLRVVDPLLNHFFSLYLLKLVHSRSSIRGFTWPGLDKGLRRTLFADQDCATKFRAPSRCAGKAIGDFVEFWEKFIDSVLLLLQNIHEILLQIGSVFIDELLDCSLMKPLIKRRIFRIDVDFAVGKL